MADSILPFPPTVQVAWLRKVDLVSGRGGSQPWRVTPISATRGSAVREIFVLAVSADAAEQQAWQIVPHAAGFLIEPHELPLPKCRLIERDDLWFMIPVVQQG